MRSVLNGRWLGLMILFSGTLSLLTGCANLSTLDRETSLGSPKAIHLDAQQRLMIMNKIGNYCAEPSPDALAAFAAAAGLGVSAPTQGAASASGSAGTSAASIGLRTQSVTLMRDALYRMCEAYGNGQLSKPQVMTLLSRSQDLTGVVLATEQLTGAVIAQQAALSSTASSDATAVMTATSQLLEAALKQQERAQARLEQAMERKTEAEGRQRAAQEEFAAAQADRNNNPGSDAAGQRARARLENADRDLNTADRQVALAEEIRALREKTLESATQRTESLQDAQDTAATTAASSASSSAALSGGGDRNRLSDQSTQAIASAVSSMVNNVLNKSYVLDYCMAMISSDDKAGAVLISDEDRKLCRKIVHEAMAAEQIRITGTVDSFAKDDIETTKCIQSWLDADASNQAKLDQWRNQKAPGMGHVIFMFGKKATKLRSAAVSDLSISCN